MKKLCLVLTLILLLVSASVFAEPFHNMDFYTGNIYLANDETSSVIIKNVRKQNGFIAGEITFSLEYTDLPIIAENIFSKDGEHLSFETINTYLLDQRVTFIAAGNSEKIKILYMEFID